MLAQGAQQYTQKVEIPDEYQQHAHVFSKKESHCFPPACSWDHAIHFKPRSPDSLNCKIYPTMPVKKKALREWINDMEEKKYIEKAKPDQAYFVSPFFFLKKKDGKRRPVQDYCGMNKLTIRDHYPIPLIPPMIVAVKNASIFTKFDI